MAPDYCPECGAVVPSGAKACPECGSDENTGWSEKATAQRLGLPDDEFDYDEFVKEEFEEQGNGGTRPRGISWMWWAVGIVLLLMLLGLWFR